MKGLTILGANAPGFKLAEAKFKRCETYVLCYIKCISF